MYIETVYIMNITVQMYTVLVFVLVHNVFKADSNNCFWSVNILITENGRVYLCCTSSRVYIMASRRVGIKHIRQEPFSKYKYLGWNTISVNNLLPIQC